MLTSAHNDSPSSQTHYTTHHPSHNFSIVKQLQIQKSSQNAPSSSQHESKTVTQTTPRRKPARRQSVPNVNDHNSVSSIFTQACFSTMVIYAPALKQNQRRTFTPRSHELLPYRPSHLTVTSQFNPIFSPMPKAIQIDANEFDYT